MQKLARSERDTHRGRPHRTTCWRVSSVLAGALTIAPAAAEAQTFVGRVVDELDNRPVPTALVRLVDAGGTAHAIAIADSLGQYRISASTPGSYHLEAARIGFGELRTPLLAATDSLAVYPIDLLMRRVPVSVSGLTVEAERVPPEQVDRQLRLMIGLSTASLRNRPIGHEEIRRHLEQGRGLVEAIRHSNVAGLGIRYTTDGPCFQLRARGCLPVYLNGLQLNRDFMGDVPLDMVHTIVVLTATDGSIVYGAGAVLLYTAAWLR